MKKNTDNLIKAELLKLYKKNNPSLPSNLNKLINIYKDSFENKLAFPLRFFKNLSVGDFACGTGEYAMIAAKNGAKVEGYDFNSQSIEFAKKNARKLKINNCQFHTKEFFKIKKKYDFVICTAALHHLPDPYKGLKFLKSRVKKGGFLFVSFGLDSSNMIHNLMKLIVRNWGTGREEIIKASKFLFKDHIDRCVKFGLRKEDNVIADQFINNQHFYLDLKKVNNIMDKGFSLHSSWPPKYLPLGDSLQRSSTSVINDSIIAPSELIWSSKTFDDIKRILKFKKEYNYTSFKKLKKILNNNSKKPINEILRKNNIYKLQKSFVSNADFSFDLNTHVNKFYQEIWSLFNFFKNTKRSLKETKKHINNKKYIFKGTNGLGLNFFIYRKN
jgi:SAM-dependent methyltransferase